MFEWLTGLIATLFAPITAPLADAFNAAEQKGADEVLTLACLVIIACSLVVGLVIRPIVNGMARDVIRLRRWTARRRDAQVQSSSKFQGRVLPSKNPNLDTPMLTLLGSENTELDNLREPELLSSMERNTTKPYDDRSLMSKPS